MSEHKTTRRTALNVLLGFGGVAAVGSMIYPVFSFLKAPRQAESSQNKVTIERKASEMKPGDWMIFSFGTKPGLLICLEASGGPELRAFSATCTHLNCIVEYQPEENKIFCPCHNGSFDVNGNNIAGPPPKPLEQYSVRVQDDTITIVKEG
jgi:Rieske Fe-S protein